MKFQSHPKTKQEAKKDTRIEYSYYNHYPKIIIPTGTEVELWSLGNKITEGDKGKFVRTKKLSQIKDLRLKNKDVHFNGKLLTGIEWMSQWKSLRTLTYNLNEDLIYWRNFTDLTMALSLPDNLQGWHFFVVNYLDIRWPEQ